MTGFPDDWPDGPDGDRTDPLGPLLRPPSGYLAAPSGAFERIRHRAARRRRLRAMAGGTAAAAVVAGTLYLSGVVVPGGGDQVVGPPASRSGISTAPGPAPTDRQPSAPTTTGGGAGTGGMVAGGQGSVPTTAPSTGGASAPTSTPAGDTPMCATSQLSAALSGGDAGAGNLYSYLVLTNHSGTACHVAGYPGLSMLTSGGRQIGQPATRRAMAYSPVVLQPGDAASSTVHTVNQQGSCLATSVRLKIYPPGNKASLTFPGRITDCDNQFEITPFTAGRTGNPPG